MSRQRWSASPSLCVPPPSLSLNHFKWLWTLNICDRKSSHLISNGNYCKQEQASHWLHPIWFWESDERARHAVTFKFVIPPGTLIVKNSVWSSLITFMLAWIFRRTALKWNESHPNLHLDFLHITPAGLTMTLRCIISALGSGSGRTESQGRGFVSLKDWARHSAFRFLQESPRLTPLMRLDAWWSRSQYNAGCCCYQACGRNS